MEKPAPPPEAVLLQLARKAAGMKTPDVAKAAGISKARLSQIENGYERRATGYRPVRGKDDTIAHLAATVGVSPQRLEEAGRPDAAAVLREIRRRQEPAQPDFAARPENVQRDLEDAMEFLAARIAQRQREEKRGA